MHPLLVFPDGGGLLDLSLSPEKGEGFAKVLRRTWVSAKSSVAERRLEPALKCLSLSPAGLHVFPTFVIYELTVLVFLTLSVVVMKV